MTISTQYHNAAKAWAEAEAQARQLEHMKEPTLLRMAKKLMADASERGESLTITAAEREVKTSPAWEQYLSNMDAARTRANNERAEMDTLIMKHEEQHGPSRVRAA